MKWHIDNQEDSDSYGIYDEAHNLVASVQDESKAGLIVTLPEMLALLQELEFCDESEVMGEARGFCPVCITLEGHDEDCMLGNLLKKLGADNG